MEHMSGLTGLISSLPLLLVQTEAARWKAAAPEQLTGAHLYLDIAKSDDLFHDYAGGMKGYCSSITSQLWWIWILLNYSKYHNIIAIYIRANREADGWKRNYAPVAFGSTVSSRLPRSCLANKDRYSWQTIPDKYRSIHLMIAWLIVIPTLNKEYRYWLTWSILFLPQCFFCDTFTKPL